MFPLKKFELIAIISPKNSAERVLINRQMYNASIHTLWEEESQECEEVTIVDPEDSRRKKVIPAEEYLPGSHILWAVRRVKQRNEQLSDSRSPIEDTTERQ